VQLIVQETLASNWNICYSAAGADLVSSPSTNLEVLWVQMYLVANFVRDIADLVLIDPPASLCFMVMVQ
jgi:hypothetical protein